jgi:hypothetical protein
MAGEMRTTVYALDLDAFGTRGKEPSRPFEEVLEDPRRGGLP